MKDMLTLSAHLPEVCFASGNVIVHEGGTTGGIWVLVSGALQVLKGDVVINGINQPGAMVGEISTLLGTAHGATVVATAPSVLRHASDGRAFCHPTPTSAGW